MLKRFKRLMGGIHPLDHKEADVSKIREIKIEKGDEFFIPFIQHIGMPSKAVIKEGDFVQKGQLLAEKGDGLSCRIHSSVTGVVKSLSTVPHYIFGNVSGCIIEAVEQDDKFEKISGGYSLADTVLNAGIVGLGGAGFPTYVKLSPKTQIDTIIINGSECEPYLMCDHTLMLNKPENILKGALLLKEYLKSSSCIIAVENNKKDCILKLKELSVKYDVDVISLPVKYPQGSEKQLIYSILGKVVPSGKIPADIGVLIQNVATVNAVYEAVTYSKPLFERIVTISGDTPNPVNYNIPNGMKAGDILNRTGNPYNPGNKVIFGGPMTGSSLSSLDIPVIKTTGGLLQLENKKRGHIEPCIRCGKCSEVCVMGLVPRDLEAFFIHNETEKNIKNGIMSCVECGCCSYICPSGRMLAETIKAGKKYASKMINDRKVKNNG